MVQSLPVGSTVPVDADNRKFVVGQFGAGGRRNGTTVQSVEDIAAGIMREFGTLTDTGYEEQVMRLYLERYQRLLDGPENGEVTAAGTPGVRYVALVVFG
jgi:hypothetical protein